MHSDGITSERPASDGEVTFFNWGKELSSYHWFVLIVAALGWLFDTMDQQLFILARTPALTELLGEGISSTAITQYGGYATAIFVAGWATGGLIFGLFGDRWGRAKTMMITILIYSLFTGLSAFSVSFYDFAFYRFVTGMGVGGEFAAGVSLVAEVMPQRARPFALGLLQALSAVGNMMAAGISFLLPPQLGVKMDWFGEDLVISGWRWMFVIGILPALLVVAIRRRLHEPEDWVKAKEAMDRGERSDELHKQMGDLRELFGDPRWRYNTIIGVTLAMAGVMSLWGVGFWTPELVRNNVLKDLPKADQDFYASMASLLQNFGAFFGIFAFSLLTGFLGRRWTFAIAVVLGLSATVAVFGFMTEQSQIWWMVPMLGACTLMIFGGYAIYFPELYPTRLRSTGTGFCYNTARYLAAAAPFIFGELTAVFAANLSKFTILSDLGSVDAPFRYAAVTVAMIYLLGLVVLPFAPETKGKPLPE